MKLPMGWQETSPFDDPTDAGTPKEEWKTTSRPTHPRKCLKAWFRGNRYVRICEVFDPDNDKREFAVHYGFVDGESNDASYKSWDTNETDTAEMMIEEAEKVCINLMRVGGYP